jgi:ATP-dependent RNA helicase HelY
MRRGLNLTSPQEKQVIHERVEAAVRDVPGEDLAALDYSAWLHALERGVSAHHAGLIPRFKEVVEGLFQDGLLKVVFATETLALGINMPARSVVIDKLSKWNGDTHVDLTAGEFTQLTGRAGRRGIDDEGNAVVVWQSDLDPIHLAGLASTRTYPLKSSFRPGYTMAANVLSSMGFSRSLSLLESSFAQFQADAGAASLIATAKKLREGQRGYAEAMECHLGNFMNYASLRVEISDLEKQASNQGRIDLLQQTLKSVEELKRGDVIVITVGRRIGPAVVLDPGNEIEGQPRPLVLTAHREVRRLSVKDFSGEVLPVERIAIPKGFDARSSRARHELAQKLKNRAFDARPRKKSAPRSADIDASIADLRHRMKQHPCHGCTDREQHARWAERYFRTEREISGLQKQIDHRTNILARDFERVCSVMLDLRYLVKENEDYVVTEDGVTLRRLHVESELILAESLRQDIFANLTPEEFAAVISVLVFESRRDEGHAAKLPRGNAEIAIREVISIWSSLRELEARHGLATVRKPDTGFAWIIYKWARGTKLASVLQESDLSAGDFVRTTRRLVDVMEQIAAVASDDVRAIAHAACDAVQRGIITALEDDEEFAT